MYEAFIQDNMPKIRELLVQLAANGIDLNRYDPLGDFEDLLCKVTELVLPTLEIQGADVFGMVGTGLFLGFHGYPGRPDRRAAFNPVAFEAAGGFSEWLERLSQTYDAVEQKFGADRAKPFRHALVLMHPDTAEYAAEYE